MTDSSEPVHNRPWPIFGTEFLAPGMSYPPMRSDDELFVDEHEKRMLMADYGLDEKQVRMARASAWI